MKKLLSLLLPSLLLTGCGLSDLFTGDTDTIHKSSYEPITGKYVLYEAIDKRTTYTDTYFDIDGNKDHFTLKYYENGELKKEGQIERVVTYIDKIGKLTENLHINVKCDGRNEHIQTYTESFSPIDQFRILGEYYNSNHKYYLSELPFVLGTYLKEGKEYKKETLKEGEIDYLTPSEECFTNTLNGYYKLDDDHYFYFLSPRDNDSYAFSYFQYYSSSLDKPLEGFIQGRSYTYPNYRLGLYLTYSRKVLFDETYQDKNNEVVFGYYTVDEEDNLLEHFGSVDFSNNIVNSFYFEHLSRNWTDEEWKSYLKDDTYILPDPILPIFVGGTYKYAL